MRSRLEEDVGLNTVLEYLAPDCSRNVRETLRTRGLYESEVYEIRLREKRRLALRSSVGCILCSYVAKAEDIRYTVRALCSGAVYAYENTIIKGFIPMPCGGRAGVVGVLADANVSLAPETVSSVNIRIPHHIRGICSDVYDLFMNFRKGIVIYSPPSVGKTTMLRDLAIELSRGRNALNVALIDTRRELDNGQIPDDCMIDTYGGYPKSIGIEIAARTMSSDVIICDELGHDEISSMKDTVVSGIPVIASAHARDISELKKRPDVSLLITAGVFDYAVGLKRDKRSTAFDFVIDKLN